LRRESTAEQHGFILTWSRYSGPARTGSSFLGVFNVTKSPITEIITLDSFPGTEQGEYLVRSHVHQTISKPASRASRKSLIFPSLDPKGYDIYTATPIRRFTIQSGEITLATLGLLGKFTGGAGIVGNDIYTERKGGLSIYTSYKALGIIGKFY
jgi:hypothetical protein